MDVKTDMVLIRVNTDYNIDYKHTVTAAEQHNWFTYEAYGTIFRARLRLKQNPAPPVANQNFCTTKRQRFTVTGRS